MLHLTLFTFLVNFSPFWVCCMLHNPRQNIEKKVKQSNKIRQDQKTDICLYVIIDLYYKHFISGGEISPISHILSCSATHGATCIQWFLYWLSSTALLLVTRIFYIILQPSKLCPRMYAVFLKKMSFLHLVGLIDQCQKVYLSPADINFRLVNGKIGLIWVNEVD